MLSRPLWYVADVLYVLNHPEERGSRTRSMKTALQPVSEEGPRTGSK